MKKIIIVVLSLLAVLALMYGLAAVFSPGSYANTEDFNFTVGKDSLINRIEKLKGNGQYNLPAQLRLRDGYRPSPDYWYHVYLFANGYIFHVGVAKIYGEDRTTLALLNLKNLAKDPSKWYRVDELDRGEKRRVMQMYRACILDSLQLHYD